MSRPSDFDKVVLEGMNLKAPEFHQRLVILLDKQPGFGNIPWMNTSRLAIDLWFLFEGQTKDATWASMPVFMHCVQRQLLQALYAAYNRMLVTGRSHTFPFVLVVIISFHKQSWR